MKRILLFLIATICFGATLSAQQATYDFLRIDVSARAAALNGSFVSMKDDPNVLFYNPAALGTLSRPKISASYLDHLMDVSVGSLSYAQHINGIGNIGGGITYINYGTFNRTNEDLEVIGSFDAKELAFLAGIATQYDENILVGMNVKYIYSSIADYTSSALAVDFGFLYDIPSQNLSIGGSVLNLGAQLKKYSNFGESLPLDVKFGITTRPEHLPIFLNLNFHRLNEKGDKFWDRFSAFTVGAEILMSESFRLRVGYNNKQRKDFKMGTSAGIAGFSMGAGLIVKDYQFDYAYNSYGKISGLHRISLGISL
jgi:long-subunit fatty acid transport protein